MTHILISILVIVVGLIGIFKNKLPKYRDGAGFAADVKFYILFYGLVAAGILSLVIMFSKSK